jgi:hypothetical protein
MFFDISTARFPMSREEDMGGTPIGTILMLGKKYFKGCFPTTFLHYEIVASRMQVPSEY